MNEARKDTNKPAWNNDKEGEFQAHRGLFRKEQEEKLKGELKEVTPDDEKDAGVGANE